MVPQARLGERDFNICYVYKAGKRPTAIPKEIIGFIVSLHFGRRLELQLTLEACSKDWVPVERKCFNSIEELFLVAHIFYKIKQCSWVGCHPLKGVGLYNKPRTKIDRLHRQFIKEVNVIRKSRSLVMQYRDSAYWAGISSNS